MSKRLQRTTQARHGAIKRNVHELAEGYRYRLIPPWLQAWLDRGQLVGYVPPDGVDRPWASYVTPHEGGMELFVMVQSPDGEWVMDRSQPDRLIDVMVFAMERPELAADFATAHHEMVSVHAVSNADGRIVTRDGVFSNLSRASMAWWQARGPKPAAREVTPTQPVTWPRRRKVPVQPMLFEKPNRGCVLTPKRRTSPARKHRGRPATRR